MLKTSMQNSRYKLAETGTIDLLGQVDEATGKGAGLGLVLGAGCK